MEKPKLNRLTPEVVNQIAAGEVIERPASVVKELLDNAIDAKSSKIVIKIKNGGISLIEISDNGIGIPKENLEEVFDAHTTSKLKNIDDLNTLMSMGFRGEALSTITSVAKVTLVSKYIDDDVAYEVKVDENGRSEIKKSPRETGTSVKVESLFYNIPARRKYLKSEQTEYRKIYELLSRYFIIYPNIHFILEKDGKVVQDLPLVPESKAGEVRFERVKDIFTEESGLKMFYSGSGISINGFASHPSSHISKSTKQYIFLNNRPITDHGIVRAVYEGYARYLPFGEKVPFVLSIDIRPDLVDVNVHPRKEEVRFENAFRVYSAVEETVRHTLEQALSYHNENTSHEQSFNEEKYTKPLVKGNDFAAMRDMFAKHESSTSSNYGKSYINNDITFNNKASSVRDSLIFSKQLLEETPSYNSEKRTIKNIFQIFNKYIVIEFEENILWIIDQHAAAERINFEKISRREKNSNTQNLLVPQIINFNEDEKLFLKENILFFETMGFNYNLVEEGIAVLSTPVEFTMDIEKMFREIFEIADTPELLSKNFEKLKHDVLATVACHTSVRSGQKLERAEMINMYNELLNCQNPYSCPHGRPAVWKLRLSEIDKNFERTY